MRRAPLLAIPTSLVLALSLAACGGDDGLSTDEYRARAKEICLQSGRETAKIAEPTKSTSAAVADYLDKLLVVNDRTRKRFEDLDPPSDLEKQHDEVIKQNARAAAEVRNLVKALGRGGDARTMLARAKPRLDNVTAEANKAVKALGVPECGDG